MSSTPRSTTFKSPARRGRLLKRLAKPVSLVMAAVFAAGIGNFAVQTFDKPTPAHAATAYQIPTDQATQTHFTLASGVSSVQWSQDALYGVGSGQGSDNNTVLEQIVPDLTTKSITYTPISSNTNYWGNNSGNGWFSGTVPGQPDTMALGRKGGTGALTAYFWSWGYYEPTGDTSPGPAVTWDNGGRDKVAVGEMDTGSDGHLTSAFYVPAGDATGTMGWSGGEVNQVNGHIYFSGYEGSTLVVPAKTASNQANTGSFRMMDYDPTTGAANFSGILQPAGGVNSLPAGTWQPSSDMAVDASGNAYILVSQGSATALGWYVLKVTPSTSGNWTYSVVGNKSLPATTNGQATGTAMNGIGTASDVWGAAFYDGLLYTYNGTYDIFSASDLMSMTTTTLSTGQLHLRDLSSAQTAPVISGVIYDDANGNGKLDSGEKPLAGQNVEIYGQDTSSSASPKPLVYLGEQDTNSVGEYSFLVNSLKNSDRDLTGDFYIRLAQPQIGGVNAAETFASANTGSSVLNPVTPLCYTASGDYQPASGSGEVACTGARADGIDHNLTSTLDAAADPADATAGANIVTKVVMNSDAEVAQADFGITTAASYGDGPINSTKADSGAYELAGTGLDSPQIGSQTGNETDGVENAAANGHSTDGGVQVKLGSSWVDLQNTILAVGTTYQVRVPVTGTARGANGQIYVKGYFSGTGSSYDETMLAVDTSTLTTTGGTKYATGSLVVPDSTGSTGIVKSYVRFRVMNWNSTYPANTTGATAAGQLSPAPGSSDADKLPWATTGEIEDYRTNIATGTLSLRGRSLSGSGSFGVSLTNVSGDSPSSDTDTFDTTAATNEGDYVSGSSAHAFDKLDTAITVTSSTVPNSGWKLVGTPTCATADGTAFTVSDATSSSFTIPAAYVKSQAALSCDLTWGQEPSSTGVVLTTSQATEGDKTVGDSSDEHWAKVTVTADDGTPLNGRTVKFTLKDAAGNTPSSSDAALSGTGQCDTGTDGSCTVSISASKAGTYTVSAQLLQLDDTSYTDSTPKSATVTFDAQTEPCSATSRIKIDPDSGTKVADGTESYAVSVGLFDCYGNALAGDKSTNLTSNVVVSPLGATGQPTPTLTAFTADSTTAGQYDATLTSTWVGTVSVQSQYLKTDGTLLDIGTVTGDFTKDENPAHWKGTLADPNPAETTAGQNITLTADINDGLKPSHPVDGATVEFDTTAPNAFGGTATSTTQVTGASGEATVTLKTTKAGTYQVNAYIVDDATGTKTALSGNPKNITIDPDKVASTVTSTLTSTTAGTGKEPGGTEYHDATVTVMDKYGNPIPNAPVDFALTGIAARTADGYSLTGNKTGATAGAAGYGSVTIHIVSDAAIGHAYVTAKIGDEDASSATKTVMDQTDNTKAAQLDLEFTSISVASITYSIDSKTGVVANGTDSHTMTLTMTSADGTPVSGITAVGGYVTFSTADAAGVAFKNWTETTTLGTYTVDVTSTVAGTKTPIVSAGAGTTVTLKSGSPSTMTFVAGTATAATFTVTTGNQYIHTGSHTVTVTVVDENGNGVTGLAKELSADAVRDQSTSATVSGFSEVDAVNQPGVYEASITTDIAGTYTVTASLASPSLVASVASGGNNKAVFIAGSTATGSTLVSLTSGGTTVQGGSVEANDDVKINVTTYDVGGNGVAGTVHYVVVGPGSQTAAAGDISTSVQSNGSATGSVVYTPTKAGDYTVHTYLGQAAAGSAESTGSPMTFSVTYDKDSVTATLTADALKQDATEKVYTGAGSSSDQWHSATVQVQDNDGNPVAGALVTFSRSGVGFVTGTAAGTADDTSVLSSTTGTDGTYSIYVKSLDQAGTATVGAKWGMPTAGSATNSLTALSLKFADKGGDAQKTTVVLTSGQRIAQEATHTITVTVKDSTGTPVSGMASSDFTIALTPDQQHSAAAGKVTWNGETATGSGVYTWTVSSQKAATYTVGVTNTKDNYDVPSTGFSDDTGKAGVQTLKFVAGPPVWTDPSAGLTVDATPVKPNNSDTVPVTVTLEDANGLPITDATFSETANCADQPTYACGAQSATLSTLEADQATPGTYTATVKSSKSGSYQVAVQMTYDGQTYDVPAASNGTANTVANFRPVVVDPAHSLITWTPTSPVVVGNGGYDVTVTAENSDGQAIPNAAVTLTSQPSGLSATGVTKDAGTFTAPFDTTTAGTYTLCATITTDAGTYYAGNSGCQATAPSTLAQVVFSPGAVDLSKTTLTGTTGTVPAGGNNYHTATLTAYDKYGNLVPNQNVTFTITDPGFVYGDSAQSQRTLTTSTGAEGTATVNIASMVVTTAPGIEVTASVGGKDLGKSVYFLFSQTGVGSNSAFSIAPAYPTTRQVSGASVTDTAYAYTVSMFLVDQNGALYEVSDPASEITASVTDAQGNDTGNRWGTWTKVADPDTSHPAGSYLYQAELWSSTAGVKTVSLTVDGAAISPQSTAQNANKVQFTPGSVQASNSTYTVSPTSVTADGTSQVPVTVALKDALGNVVTGAGSALTGSAVSSTVNPTFKDNGDGTYSTYVTSTVPGAHAVTINYSGTALNYTTNGSANFTVGAASGSSSELTVSRNQQTVGQAVTASVQINDALGNPVGAGQSVTVWTTPGTTGNQATAWTASTDSTGLATVDFTSTTATTYQVYAALGAAASPSDTSLIVTGSGQASTNVTFTAGAPSATNSTMVKTSGDSAQINSTPGHSIVFTIKDAYGNPVAGAQISPTLTGLAQAQVTESGADAQTGSTGTVTLHVTSTAIGTATLTATAAGVQITQPASSIALVFQNTSIDTAKYRIPTFSDTVTADGSAQHQVVIDLTADGQPTTADMSGAINLTATRADGTAAKFLGWSATGTTGEYASYVTSEASGTFTIGGTVGTATATPATSGHDYLKFTAGTPSASTSTFEVGTETHVANGEDANQATITVKDRYGNPVTGLKESDFTPGGALLTFGEFTATSTSGVYTYNITSTTATPAGGTAVTVQVDGVDITGGANHNATFVAGPPSDVTSSMVLVSSGAKVIESEYHEVLVTVLDRDKNPVAGASVTISGSGAGTIAFQSGSGTYQTNAAGQADVFFTADKPDTYQMTANVVMGSKTISLPTSTQDPVAATFKYGSVDYTKSYYSVTQDSDIVANGTDYQTVTVVLRDAAGNGVGGRTLTVGYQPTGPNQVVWQAANPNQPGVYTGQITSLKSGSFDVSAQLSGSSTLLSPGPTSDAKTTATFQPGTPVADNSELRVSDTEVAVNDEITATVTVKDANGNLVPNASVSLWTTPADPLGGATRLVGRSQTDGTATFTLTTTKAGTYTVFADVATATGTEQVKNSGTTTVTFDAGAVDLSASTLVATLQGSNVQVMADGTSVYEATATVTDSYGNPLAGQAVTFVPTGPGTQAQVTPSNQKTDENGQVVVQYVSDQIGAATLQAYVGSTATDLIGGTSPVTLKWNWITATVDLSKSYYTLTTGPKYANGTDQHTITVYLFGQDGTTPARDQQSLLAWTLTKDAAGAAKTPGYEQLENFTADTDFVQTSPGVYTANVTSTWATILDVAATYNGTAMSLKATSTTASASSVQFLPLTTPDQTKSGYEVSTTAGVVADGNHYQQLVATVRDQYGNGITGLSAGGANGRLQASETTGLVSIDWQAADSANPGVYTANLSTTVSGTYGMTATLDGAALAPGVNTDATFVPGSAGSLALAKDQAGPIAVGQSYEYTVTVSDKADGTGNGVPNATVTVSLDATGGAPTDGTLSATKGGSGASSIQVTTGDTGRATFYLTSTHAKTYQVKAVLQGQNLSQSDQAAFKAGSVDASTSTLTGDDQVNIAADGTSFHYATVTAKDAYGNTVSGAAVAFSVSGVGTVVGLTDSTANDSLRQGQTGDDGTYTIHLVSKLEPGTAKVAATVGGNPITASDGSAVQLALKFVSSSVVPGNSYYILSTGTRVAGDTSNPHTIDLYLRDSAGAPVEDDKVDTSNLQVAFPDGSGSQPAIRDGQFTRVGGDADMGHYRASIDSTLAGTFTVSPSYAGGAIPVYSNGATTVQFVNAAWSAGTSSYTVSNKTGVVANNSDTQTVTATILDQYGNGVPDVTGLTGTATPASVDNSGWTAVTGQVGVYQTTVKSLTAGKLPVHVSYGTTALSLAQNGYGTADFVPGAPDSATSTLLVSSGDKVAGVDQHTATVTVRDQGGNTVTGAPIRIYVTPNLQGTAGDATSSWSATTQSDGTYQVSFTSTKAGVYQVYAALSPASGAETVFTDAPQPVTFVAGPVSQATSTIERTSPATVAANSGIAHTAVVHVRDQFGNAVTGSSVSVKFSYDQGTAAGSQITSQNPASVDSDGDATVSVTSPNAGTGELTASVNGTAVTQPVSPLDLQFVTGTTPGADSYYKVAPTGPIASDGQAAYTVTVHLVDSNDAAMSEAAGNLSMTATAAVQGQGDATNVSGFTETSTKGVYTGTIKSTNAGVKNVTVNWQGGSSTIPPDPATGRDTVEFSFGEPSTSVSTYQVTTGTRLVGGDVSACATSDGSQCHQVTVTLADSNGNKLTGMAGKLTATGTDATISAFTEADAQNQPGVYQAWIVSNVASDIPISVSVKNAAGVQNKIAAPAGANVTASFVAGEPDATNSTLTATTGDKTAKTGYHTATVTIRDGAGAGNPLDSLNVTISAVRDSTGAALTLPNGGVVTTGQDGTASLQFTAPDPGYYTLSATVLTSIGAEVHPTGSGTVKVHFVTGTPSADTSWYKVSKTANVIADPTDPTQYQTITVRVMDASSNGLTGLADDLRATFADSAVTVGAFTEDATDYGTYTAKIQSSKAGSFQPSQVGLTTATSLRIALQSGENGTATFVAGPADATQSSLSADPTKLTVGGTATATVHVVDQYGNDVASQPVRFTVSPLNADGSPLNSTADFKEVNSGTDGTAQIPLTTKIAGTYTITAQLVSLTGQLTDVTNSGAVSVEFDEGAPDLTKSMLTGDESTDVVADGSSQHTVQLALEDANGNPVRSHSVVFALSGVGQVASGETLAMKTDATTGIATLHIVSTQIGDALVQATVDGQAVTNGGSAAKVLSLPFVSGSYDAGASSYTVSTGTRVADGTDAHQVTVTLADEYGNPISGVGGDLGFAADPADATFGPVAETPLGSGVYTADITSHVAGTKAITVTYDGGPVALQKNGNGDAVFVPGTAVAGNSYFTVTDDDGIVADGTSTQTVTVTVRDKDGNGVPNLDKALKGQATATDATSGATASVGAFTAVAGSTGVYTAPVTATVATTYRVTVTLNGSSDIGHVDPDTNTSLNDLTHFVAGAATSGQSYLVVSQGSVKVGETHTVTAYARDAEGNPVQGVTFDFSAEPTASAGAAQFSANSQTTGEDGTAQVTVTAQVADTYQVHAKLHGDDIKDSPASAVFTFGDPNANTSSLQIPTQVSDPTKLPVANNSDTHTIQVTVRDGSGNPVQGWSAKVQITDPTGKQLADQQTGLSDKDGVATLKFKSALAGDYSVSAYLSIDGSDVIVTGSPATATFIPGPASANQSEIQASQGRIQANGIDASTLTVTLRDAEGNLLSAGGDDVELTASCPDGTTCTLGRTRSTAATDNGDGTYTAQLTATGGSGTATIGFSVNGTVSSKTAKVAVVKTPSTPDIDYANATHVVGKADPGNTVSATDDTGAQVCTATVKTDGTFDCVMGTARHNGDQLQVLAEDSNGYRSDTATATVDAIPPTVPTVDPSNGDKVSGKTDPSDAGNTVQVVDPGTGEVLCETTVKADGTFECDGLNPKPDDGAEIQVIVTDPANNPSDPATVVIDGTAPDKPVLEPSDGSAVYGTAEPGSTVKVTDEDGNVVCETTADKATGSFACVPDKPMDDGEEFDVTATDAAGNESDPAHGRVDQSEVPEPTVDPTNGSEVTGTGIPGAKVTVTLPDGSEYETTVDPDGKWSVTPPDTYVPKDGDEVEVTQEVPFNRDGDKTSKPVVVPLDTVAPPAPSPAPSDGATLSGTEKVDEAGDMVTVKDPNGAVIGTALVDPDGSWTAALAPHAKEGDQLSITVTDPAGNVSAAKKWRVGLLKVTVGSTSVVAGGQQTVQVENLQPGEAATLTLMPDGVKLEPVAGDANGSATLKFTVRTDASTTVQHLVQAVGPLSGTANSGYFTVTAPAPVPYQVQVTPTVTTTAAARHVVQTPTVAVHPATGAEGLMGAVGAGLGLLLAGLLLLLAARRRRRDEQEV